MLNFERKLLLRTQVQCQNNLPKFSGTNIPRQAKLIHRFIRYGLITVHGQQDLKFGVINHHICDEMNVCYRQNPISLTSQFEDCRS